MIIIDTPTRLYTLEAVDVQIFVGDPLILYEPIDEFVIPDHAEIYHDDPFQLVGCLRRSYAESGAYRAGFWISWEDGDGQVYRVPTVQSSLCLPIPIRLLL